jgi:hypothetical protein
MPSPRVLPGAYALFARLSASFIWLIPIFLVTARVARIVLMHSSNRLPSG